MLVAADRGFDLAAGFVGRTVDEGDVVFINKTLAKLLRQSLVYLVCFGNDDQPRCVFVEAVDNPDSVRTPCGSGGLKIARSLASLI